jgi:AcrR family transcriptional regulator
MRRSYSVKEIARIKSLRIHGASIPEIMQTTGLPKTSIWYHVKSIKLPRDLFLRIQSRRGGSKNRAQHFTEKAKSAATQIFGKNKKYRNLIRATSMLYWAEGSKRECVFTNTDVTMVNIFFKVSQMRTPCSFFKHRVTN